MWPECRADAAPLRKEIQGHSIRLRHVSPAAWNNFRDGNVPPASKPEERRPGNCRGGHSDGISLGSGVGPHFENSQGESAFAM